MYYFVKATEDNLSIVKTFFTSALFAIGVVTYHILREITRTSVNKKSSQFKLIYSKQVIHLSAVLFINILLEF